MATAAAMDAAMRLWRDDAKDLEIRAITRGAPVHEVASPGPNNAEKEGAGRGENEGEREP
jgi:hypothetical protein